MLTRRNVLKKFVSVAAGGMALLGLKPAKASSTGWRPSGPKRVEGKVTWALRPISCLRYFKFGSHEACLTDKYIVTIIRDGRRMLRSAKDVKIGDTIYLPKYLTERWVRTSILKSWNREHFDSIVQRSKQKGDKDVYFNSASLGNSLRQRRGSR